MRTTLILLALAAAGCDPEKPSKPPAYRHSTKATAREDRLSAIREREQKYGGTR